MNDDIGGVWRTVGGRRIFIKAGKDLATAMKESGKFNNISSSNKLKSLEKQLAEAKGFLQKAKINNEITALKNAYDSYEEYQKAIQEQKLKNFILKDVGGNEHKVNETELTDFLKDKKVDINDWQNCDNMLQEQYAEIIGFSSKMKSIAKSEYEKYNGIELSRIVTGKTKDESNNIVSNSKIGNIRYSDERHSYYGKGLYYGDKKMENKLYEEYGNKNSSIINCKISKDARIIEVNDISDYISTSNKLAKGIKDSKVQIFYDNPSKNRNIMYMNAGVDIIKVKRDNYYVVLNRGVLITYDE